MIKSPFEKDVLPEVLPQEGQLPLSFANVDSVLNEVRPFLIVDGGNIRVVAVDPPSGVVKLQLEGACVSCSSATTTMQQGVEKALLRKFGSQISSVVSADEDTAPSSHDISLRNCQAALASIEGILQGFGASVSVLEVDEDEVVVAFSGPPSLKLGVEQTLRDKVDGIDIVTFESE